MTRSTTAFFVSGIVVLATSSAACLDPGNDAPASATTASPDTTSAPDYPTVHPRIYLTSATQTRLKASVAANTTAWQTFKGDVDEWMGGDDIWGFDEWNAALVSNLTGETRYCTQAIATSDAQVTAAGTAAKANTAPVIAGDDYLQVGPMLTNVALDYDWCYSQLTSSQRTAWIAYMNQALYNVWNPNTAAWGGNSMPWDGWAIDDPNDNYYYSFLEATMMVGLATYEDNSEATTWLAQFRTTKLYDQAFPDFDADLVGGGSREGTDYGVSMRGLWQLYDWWQISTGEDLAVQTPHTLASLTATIYQVMPTLDYVAPTGDQPRVSNAPYFDYNRQYLAELAQIFPTAAAAGPAKTLNAASSIPAMTEQFMSVYDFLYDDSTVTATPLSTLPTSYYASGMGQLYARSDWTTNATWVNLTGGPYTESHAHQDQGALMMYRNGWLATDAVIWSQSGLRQETNAHGLVRIDSGGSTIAQVATTTSTMYPVQTGTTAGVTWLHAAVDVTAAYAGNPDIQKVQREIIFLQPSTVVVYDRVTTSSGTTQTWQMPTPAVPSISGENATVATAGHSFHVHRSMPASASEASYSMTSDPSDDYSTGYRLDEAIAGGDNRFLNVLSVDSAVESLVDGTNRVDVRLAGGVNVGCVFSNAKIGGKIEIAGTTVEFATTPDTLPSQ